MDLKNIPLTILDLAVVKEGQGAREAIEESVLIAQEGEKLGYRSIWFAEHHNMPHIASSATSILMGHIAGKTSTIKVGSGGIMLPNHSPLVIAEQFGTLETLYPGRIELGLGRAPGTDQLTAMALRRTNMNTAFSFPQDVQELWDYFRNEDPEVKVRAFPGEGLKIPFYILGSSTDSAHLAAALGLPYAFAPHFAPAQLKAAVQIYRSKFKPSEVLDRPHVMVCVNAFGADTDSEAYRISTSMFRMFIGLVTNRRAPLAPPVNSLNSYWTPDIQHAVMQMASCTFMGNQESLQQQFQEFATEVPFDELIISSYIYDREAKFKSLEIIRNVFQNN